MSIVKYSVINLLDSRDSETLVNGSSNTYPAEMLFIEPIRYIKYIKTVDKRESGYINCPAFLDFFKNVFVVLSPIDIAINFNKEQRSFTLVGQKGVDQNFINKHIVSRLDQLGKLDKPLMTAVFSQLVFYTEEPVMLEALPIFTLYKKNINYNTIPGRFRIDRWIRPIDFSFEFIDETKPILIKRGDPIFTFRLSSENDSRIELERELIVDKELIYQTIFNHTSIKQFIPKLSLSAAYEVAKPFINLFWKQKK